jgi:hypothetical protein
MGGCMKLAEAIKFKRPIRRMRKSSTWYGEGFRYPDAIEDLSVEDAIADDWEVQEKQTFTRHELKAAINETIRLTKSSYQNYSELQITLKAFAAAEKFSELGEEVEE